MPMPSMGYWGAWRCRSAKDWRIRASPQSSTGAPAYLLRQGRVDALDDAVLSHQVPARHGLQPPQGGGGDDGPLDDGQ